jgi:transcriptional/translational regulatory protein YebC/TACO1
MFHRKACVTLPREAVDEDALTDLVWRPAPRTCAKTAAVGNHRPAGVPEPLKQALAARGVSPATAEISMIPQNTIRLEGSQAQQMLRLLDALEEHDDVQHVYANFDIAEKEIEAAMAAS